MEELNSEYQEELKQYLEKIPKMKIKDGKSLIDLSTYEGITMWWFVNVTYYIYINQLSNSICYKKPLKEIRNSVNSLNFGFYIYLLYELFSSFLCKLNVKLYNPKRTCGENKILIVSQNLQWRTIRDPLTKKFKKTDAFFDSIISKLNENDKNEIITTYPLYYPISGLKVLINRMKTQKESIHKPFDIYWSRKVVKKGIGTKKYFSNIWKDIKNNKNFKELLKYKNTEQKLTKKLSFYFNEFFAITKVYIEMAKLMLDKENPNLVLLLNEQGPFERALVIASKLKGIPTIALQHGMISSIAPGYIYNKKDKAKVILPNITCVYGNYYYNLLTKKSIYDPKQVVVTGQPRYDVLFYADEIYCREKFVKKYGINPTHKIILWTTTSQGISEGENIKNFEVVFRTLQNLKNTTLIIKQHPGEGEKYTKMIKKYLKKYKIKAIIPPKNSDTYEQIFVCDLMITKDSTTAMEAVALNKPVIVLNLSGEADVVDYVEQKVALGVYKKDYLKPTIEKLLKDDSVLAKNRKKFIENYLYKIDGKATERVVELIEERILKN